MSTREVSDLLRRSAQPWPERLALLQGWRGPDVACAAAARGAQRIGPATCAVGATLGAVTRSPLLLGAVAATAVAGTVAPNHPFERVWNWVARDRQLPANRAAKRLGCVIGALLLGGGALAYAVGAATLGLVLALVLAVTAAFVAITGICIPSMIFTAVWGSDRASAPHLVARS